MRTKGLIWIAIILATGISILLVLQIRAGAQGGSGAGGLAADVADLQDAVAALQGQVAALQADIDADHSIRVSRSDAIQIDDSEITAVPFDNVRWDTDGIFDPDDSTRLTAGTSGKYLIFGHIRFAGNATELRLVAILKNGNHIANDIRQAVSIGGVPGCGSICPTDVSISTHHILNEGDSVQLVVLQNSGATLAVLAGNAVENSDSDFGMVKVP